MDDHLFQTLTSVKDLKDIAVDVPGFRGVLAPHQRCAVAFAVLAEKSLNLLQVGLGKTVTSIATDLKLRSLGTVRKTLVVSQAGKKFDWRAEYERFSDLRVVLVSGSKSKRVDCWMAGQSGPCVTVAGYESVRSDVVKGEKLPDGKNTFYLPSNLLQYLSYDLVVFDEVTIFKSWETTMNLALQALIQRARPRYCIGLSATPIQKSLTDLYSVCDKVIPGLLGDKQNFEDRYLVRRFIEGSSGNYWKVVGYQNEEELAAGMAPYYFRREKREIYGDTLRVVQKVRRVLLTTEQLRHYAEIQHGTSPLMPKADLLRKFSDLEKTVDTMAYFADKKSRSSAKIEDLKNLLTGELADEKVVVFSKHLLPLSEVEDLILKPEKIDYIRYTGREVDLEARERERHRFLEDPNCRVALVTSAAEMGYDFHSAAVLVCLNHIYNPGRMEQLRGRIDRPLVQKSPVICVIHYVAVATFEEAIIPNLHKEANLMKKVFGATNSFDSLNSDLIESMSERQLFRLIKTSDL